MTVQHVPGPLRRKTLVSGHLPAPGRSVREEDRDDDRRDGDEQVVEREDPQCPPEIEVTEKVRRPPVVDQNPRDEEAAEDEEEIDPIPSDVRRADVPGRDSTGRREYR